MATVPESPVVRPEGLDLHTGDRMTREEFHRIYQQMPEDFEAELIGGTVYVGSPLKRKIFPVRSATRSFGGSYRNFPKRAAYSKRNSCRTKIPRSSSFRL